jgi:hypothetical protein
VTPNYILDSFFSFLLNKSIKKRGGQSNFFALYSRQVSLLFIFSFIFLFLDRAIDNIGAAMATANHCRLWF